jgi:Beta-mannanase
MKIIVLGLIIIWSTSVFADGGKDKIRQNAVDKEMTDETATLLSNIHHLQKRGMMIGQHDGVWMEEHKGLNSHFNRLSGRQPAMVCNDFMFITNRGNVEGSFYRVREHEIKANIIAANRAGLYQTMCWHYNDPYIGKTFYVKDLPEEYGQNSFRSILKGGVNHETYKKDLRKVAEFSLSLKDDNGKLIPFIFRPFHEFDGEWFWWGAPYNTPEEFKAIWQFTVEYLRDTLNVHNMLYAFSPDIRFNSKEEFLIRYPGDDYVDIIGFDDYEDFKYDKERTEKAKDRIRIVAEIGKEKNKPVALTELGYFIKHNEPKKEIDADRTKWMLEAVSEMNEYLAYIVFWGNGGTYDYCVPSAGLVGEKDFLDFLNQPFVIMNDNKEEKLK